MEMFRFTWMEAHGAIIDVDGDTAEARLYINEYTCDMQGVRRLALGVYHDRYVIEDGRWRFAVRHWSFLYLGPPDMSAKFWDMPAFGPPPHDADIDRPNTPSLADLRRELGL